MMFRSVSEYSDMSNSIISCSIDGKIKAIFCKENGSIVGGVGELLYSFYSTPSKAKALVNSGRSIISLKPNMANIVTYRNYVDSYWNHNKGMTFNSLDELLEECKTYQEIYYYQRYKWYVRSYENHLLPVVYFADEFKKYLPVNKR